MDASMDEISELDEVQRAYGELLWAMDPLPPGLDWDYFAPLSYDLSEEASEVADTENPAIDDVFDWGMPLIGAEVEDFEICERA